MSGSFNIHELTSNPHARRKLTGVLQFTAKQQAPLRPPILSTTSAARLPAAKYRNVMELFNTLRIDPEKASDVLKEFVQYCETNVDNSALTDENKDLLLDKIYAHPMQNRYYWMRNLLATAVPIEVVVGVYVVINYIEQSENDGMAFLGGIFFTFLFSALAAASCKGAMWAHDRMQEPVYNHAADFVAWLNDVHKQMADLDPSIIIDEQPPRAIVAAGSDYRRVGVAPP